MVDLNIDSIDFTIQLRDDEGNNLELAGIEIEVEVDSRDIFVDADETGGTPPRPTPLINREFGGRSQSTTTVVTDDDGEAFFELFAPRRDERLDIVTFRADCDRCDLVDIDIAWTERDPVLVSAIPQFESPTGTGLVRPPACRSGINCTTSTARGSQVPRQAARAEPALLPGPRWITDSIASSIRQLAQTPTRRKLPAVLLKRCRLAEGSLAKAYRSQYPQANMTASSWYSNPVFSVMLIVEAPKEAWTRLKCGTWMRMEMGRRIL